LFELHNSAFYLSVISVHIALSLTEIADVLVTFFTVQSSQVLDLRSYWLVRPVALLKDRVCHDIVYFSSHHSNRRLNPTYANVLESFNDHSVTRVPQQMMEEKGERNKMTNTEEVKKE
jgi:hypothetical protein